MSNENGSIHDFDFNLICEYFSHMERQGPGSPGMTLRALSFTEECWTDHFYAPQPAVQEAFLRKHAGNLKAELLISELRREEAMYDKYKAYYGYVFYIGKKI